FSRDGIQSIEFFFYLTDSTVDSLGLFDALSVNLLAHDSNFLKNFDPKKNYNPDLLAQLVNKNLYLLSPYQINRVSFQQYKNESIAATPKNIFGIPPTDYERDINVMSTF
ncbi:5335_t:CDS:2, partial [Ambispora leptoticha]